MGIFPIVISPLNATSPAGDVAGKKDMVKIGLLYLNKGTWNGSKMTLHHLPEQTFIPQMSTTYNSKQEREVGYNNQFSIPAYIVEDGYSTVLEDVGNGGQLILINRKLNLVLVITAGNYNVRI